MRSPSPRRLARAVFAVLVLAAGLTLGPVAASATDAETPEPTEPVDVAAPEPTPVAEPEPVPTTVPEPEPTPPPRPEPVADPRTEPVLDPAPPPEPAAPVPDADAVGAGVAAPTGMSMPEADISMTKTVEPSTVLEGLPVTFTIVVMNTGGVDLHDVEVTDWDIPDCGGDGLDDLDVGESDIVTCIVTPAESFTNTATAEAFYDNECYDDYYECGGCEYYECEGDCYDECGGGCDGECSVSATDSATVTVIPLEPGISISKEVVTTPILPGEDADFRISVENTGDYPLFDITVSDPLVADCAGPVDDLDPGESATVLCTADSVTESFTNTATVDAFYDDCGDGCDEPIGAGPAEATVTVIDPAISITKDALTTPILEEEDADFEIVVTNTGDVELFDITVSDPLVADCAGPVDDLDPGESATVLCTADSVTESFTNTATVDAFYDDCGDGCDEPIGAGPAEATVTVIPLEPGISITKDALTTPILPGEDATFEITVENTGNLELDVEVTDGLTPDCDRPGRSLEPGETFSYMCVAPAVFAPGGSFTNVAEVVGSYESGSCECTLSVEDEDSATVVVLDPPSDPPPLSPPPTPGPTGGVGGSPPPPPLPVVIIIPATPPPPGEPPAPAEVEEPAEPEEPETDDPDAGVTVTTDEDVTLVTGASVLLEGPAPGCVLNVLIDGETVAGVDDESGTSTFTFRAPTDGLSVGEHTAEVRCADGTPVFERPFTIVRPVANNGAGAGLIAFLLFLVLLLGGRFLLGGGTVDDPS